MTQLSEHVVLPRPLVVRDRDFEVRVDGAGNFLAELDGSSLMADTMEGLRQKLLDRTKVAAVRLNLPVTIVVNYGGGLVDGEITGVHAGNENVMLRYPDNRGRATTNQYTHGQTVLRRLEPDEKERWTTLRSAYVVAKQAFEDFEKRVTIRDVRRHTERAIEEAQRA